jgi:photosystem II stability/assembly factor-like uncharacterized protein
MSDRPWTGPAYSTVQARVGQSHPKPIESTIEPNASASDLKSMSRHHPRLRIAIVLLAVCCRLSIAGDHHAVFKSVDNGQTWVRADVGLPVDSRINTFGSVEGTVLAGTDAGIYLSTDAGGTWQPTAGVAGSSGRVICIATFGTTQFAGIDGAGLLVSNDAGRSWSRDSRFPREKVRCLLVHQGELLAGTDAGGILVTKDGGANWERRSNGLPSQAQIFALAGVGGRLFAGLYSKGLFAWNPIASDWSKLEGVSPLVLASAGDTLIAGHNPGGIYWSETPHNAWMKGISRSVGELAPTPVAAAAELAAESPVWELGSNGELVLAGAAAGIFRSEDRGRTWTRAHVGLPKKRPGIAFLVGREFILACVPTNIAEPGPGNDPGAGFPTTSDRRD